MENLKCPNCGEELESWVKRKDLPTVKKACKTFEKLNHLNTKNQKMEFFLVCALCGKKMITSKKLYENIKELNIICIECEKIHGISSKPKK